MWANSRESSGFLQPHLEEDQVLLSQWAQGQSLTTTAEWINRCLTCLFLHRIYISINFWIYFESLLVLLSFTSFSGFPPRWCFSIPSPVCHPASDCSPPCSPALHSFTVAIVSSCSLSVSFASICRCGRLIPCYFLLVLAWLIYSSALTSSNWQRVFGCSTCNSLCPLLLPNRSEQDLLSVSSHWEVFFLAAAASFLLWRLSAPVCKRLWGAFGCDSAFLQTKMKFLSRLRIGGSPGADLCRLLKCFYVHFNTSHVFPQLFVVWRGFKWFQCNWFLVAWRQQTHPTRGHTNWAHLVWLWCKSAPV